MKTDLYNSEGKKTGVLEIPDRVFGAKWNPALVHQALLVQASNKRQSLAHTKDRSEVRGGGKKPWRQKHTGRARHGSSRSPLWSGGGVTFGPRNEKDFSKKMNKQMKRLALYSVLSKKLKEGDLFFVEKFGIDAPKTKEMAKFLKSFFKKSESVLCIPRAENKNIFFAGRNIPKTKISPPQLLNIHDSLSQRYIIFERDAVQELPAR